MAGLNQPLIDWGCGLPVEILDEQLMPALKKAGVGQIIRQVCPTWQSAFDRRVTKLSVSLQGPPLPAGTLLHQRHPKLLHLNIGEAPFIGRQLQTILAGLDSVRELNLGSARTSAPKNHPEGVEKNPPVDASLYALCKDMQAVGLEGVGSLPSVRNLHLGGCTALRNEAIQKLGGMGIRRLDLTSCHELTDEVFPHLLRLVFLEDLVLDRCTRISGQGLAVIRFMRIRRLSLKGCKGIISPVPPHPLEPLREILPPTLKHLSLEECSGLTALAIPHILHGLLLTSLILAEMRPARPAVLPIVTDGALVALGGMPLAALDLSGNPEITDAGLATLQGLPLTKLKLGRCRQITGAGLAGMQGIPLAWLDLSACNRVTNEGMLNLVGFPLTKLGIRGFRHMTDVGLGHLVGMPLTELDMRSAKEITDEGLEVLAGMQLRYLDLGHCVHVSNDGLTALVGMPLEYLVLSSLPDLSLNGLLEVRNAPLVHLDVSRSLGLSLADIATFKQASVNGDIISIVR